MMKMKNIKAIFRRGQNQVSTKNEPGNNINENLSRSSSVTNINAEHKNKGAFSKLRKSASKDRLDKLTEKKNDKKGFGSNNNKLDSADVDHSLESTQEIEILQKQLFDMAKEKSSLALELGERKGELQSLKNEIVKLKMFQDQSTVRIEQLNDENTSLRNRLRDVADSPLSDNEKQQLLESHRHSSAPASIATNLLDDGTLGDVTACTTPDWDKHSSSNVSEVSLACLQDKINQMQETHYSTNEELQATLQELTDLQRQLTELQQDNERLSDEKNLMFDSLCRQTERLNDARSEVESLKQLLYREKDENGQLETIVDREQKLVDLLKSGQEERESLLVKQEQLTSELQETRSSSNEQVVEIEKLSERVRTLESTLDAKHAEHRQIDQELAIAKDQCSGRHIEINRLTDLLDNARTKINELEQERALNDKSELDELLDNARKEKDTLESEVTDLKEQIALSRNEAEKLREQVRALQEECMVTRNNAKCTQSELEYRCEKFALEKANLSEQLQQLQEVANEFQVQAQCQLDDNRQLSTVLSETQRNLSETERKNSELANEVEELNKIQKAENEEWKKFQNDLLTSVRVANDFKSEAQQELQKMIMENKAHREKIRQLETQLDKFKGNSKCVDVEKQKLPLSTSTRPEQSSSGLNDTTPSEQPSTFLHSKQNVTNPSNASSVKKESDNSKKLSFLPVLSKISGKAKEKPEEKQKLEEKQKPTEAPAQASRYVDFSKLISSKRTKSVPNVSEIKSEPNPTPKAFKSSKRTLSEQEELDLALLNSLHSQIDPNALEGTLTNDQKFILRVKSALDTDLNATALKPVKKQKEQVAISKPLLTSVLNNPKLKEITEDATMVSVEKDDPLETNCELDAKPVSNFNQKYDIVTRPKKSFDNYFNSKVDFQHYDLEHRPKSVSSFKPDAINKSKSLTDLYPDEQTVSESEIVLPHGTFDDLSSPNLPPKLSPNKKSWRLSEPLASILKDPKFATNSKSSEVSSLDELEKDRPKSDSSMYTNDSGLKIPRVYLNSPIFRSDEEVYEPSFVEDSFEKGDETSQELLEGGNEEPSGKNFGNLEVLLRSKLEEAEVRFVQKIYNESSRPTSNLNEEELELVTFSQRRCRSGCVDFDRKVAARHTIGPIEASSVWKVQELGPEEYDIISPPKNYGESVEEMASLSLVEVNSKNDGENVDELASLTVVEDDLKNDGESVEEIGSLSLAEDNYYGENLETITSFSLVEDNSKNCGESVEEMATLSLVEDNSQSYVESVPLSLAEDSWGLPKKVNKSEEPIYANYSKFLQQMLHDGGQNCSRSSTTKKPPFPLPRRGSKENSGQTIDGSFDSRSNDSSSNDHVKILSDVSHPSENFKETRRSEEVEEIMRPRALDEFTEEENSPRIFGNLDKYYLIHQIQAEKTRERAEEGSVETENEIVKRLATYTDLPEPSIKLPDVLNESRPSTTSSSPAEFYECDNEQAKTPSTEVDQTKEGFSIFKIIDQLSHYFDAPPTEEATTTFVNSNFNAKDDSFHLETNTAQTTENSTITSNEIPTQTGEPHVVAHHYHQQSGSKEENSSNLPNYDTLERLTTYEILNNPPPGSANVKPGKHHCPKCHRHRHQHVKLDNFKIESAKTDVTNNDDNDIGSAIKKFENLIQAQQGVNFQSQTVKRVSATSKIPTRIDK